jgi:hypothetical protein
MTQIVGVRPPIRHWVALASQPLIGRSYHGALEHREYGEGYVSHCIDRWDCSHAHRTRRAAIDCAVTEARARWITL